MISSRQKMVKSLDFLATLMGIAIPVRFGNPYRDTTLESDGGGGGGGRRWVRSLLEAPATWCIGTCKVHWCCRLVRRWRLQAGLPLSTWPRDFQVRARWFQGGEDASQDARGQGAHSPAGCSVVNANAG